jgi:propanol-preferring alcohol dehydrogenase
MRAMVLRQTGPLADNPEPLLQESWPTPVPGEKEVLVRVAACGVCHTELDQVEGRIEPPKLPVIPGHQIVGTVEATGNHASRFRVGDRVGIAWIYHACGRCEYCTAGLENLCPFFEATGRDANGGYAEFTTVHEEFAVPIPEELHDVEAAPLLCAGAIGQRSLKLTALRNGERLGLMGFGASAHLVLQLARYRFPDSPIYVFARSSKERKFALELGAVWAGDISEKTPEALAAIIDTTPAWLPVVKALGNLAPAGRLVINAIRKEEADKQALLSLDYPADLWREKVVRSVANVTRADVVEFLDAASQARIRPSVALYPLIEANRALQELKAGYIRGAKVLVVQEPGRYIA